MSTAEMLFEKARHLPENLQAEALHYVDFLLTRRAAEKEDKEWSQFSATQPAHQYSPEDAIYEAEDILEAAWTKAVSASPAFDFLKDAAEDVYTAADGKPFPDQAKA